MQAIYNPWSLCQSLDDNAKFWWGVAISSKVVGFFVGVLAVVLNWPSKPMPFVLAALALLSEAFSYRSDSVRGQAQALRRKLDLKDGLGWELSNAELSDLIVRCPASVKEKTRIGSSGGAYFASEELPGPRRAMENVSESAWWSKHLSEKMFMLCLMALVVSTVGVVFALVVAIQAASGPAPLDMLSNVARVATAILMFLISLGVFKLATGYFGLSKKAARVEESAERLLKSGATIELADALSLVGEYHVARACAPIIPTWVWKLNQHELNGVWRELRRSKNKGTN